MHQRRDPLHGPTVLQHPFLQFDDLYSYPYPHPGPVKRS